MELENDNLEYYIDVDITEYNFEVEELIGYSIF